MRDNNGRKPYRNNYKKPRKEGEFKAVAVNDKYSHIEPVQAYPLEVEVNSNGNNFERAMRAFRAIIQKERVLSIYKEKQSYEKPSDKRRRKVNESKRKQMEMCSKGDCVHSDHAINRELRQKRRNASE
jgi:ribosomal protein S21